MRTERTDFVRQLLAWGAVCALVLPWAAGCQGLPIASARFTNGEYVPASQHSLPRSSQLQPTPAQRNSSQPTPAQPDSNQPIPAQPAPEQPPVAEPIQTPNSTPARPVSVNLSDVPDKEDEFPLDDPPPEAQRPPSPVTGLESTEKSVTESTIAEHVSTSPTHLRKRQVARSTATPLLPAIPSQRMHANPPNAQHVGPSCDTSCDTTIINLPASGSCGLESCPPLLAIPRCRLRGYMGPLFNREAPYDEQALAEAELQPPFARFHPVPTAPVFETQYDYHPPQLMMVPVKQPHHRAPRLLSPYQDADPTEALPYDAVTEPFAPPANLTPLGVTPPATAAVETARRAPAPNWRAGTIHKHRYAY